MKHIRIINNVQFKISCHSTGLLVKSFVFCLTRTSVVVQKLRYKQFERLHGQANGALSILWALHMDVIYNSASLRSLGRFNGIPCIQSWSASSFKAEVIRIASLSLFPAYFSVPHSNFLSKLYCFFFAIHSLHH